MIFLLIHETFCDFFPTQYSSSSNIKKSDVVNNVLGWKNKNIDRFLNNNDLALSIPKDHRGDEEKIIAYMNSSADIYLQWLKNWEGTKSATPAQSQEQAEKRGWFGGGGKKSVRKYKKKRETKRRRKNRGFLLK